MFWGGGGEIRPCNSNIPHLRFEILQNSSVRFYAQFMVFMR